MKRSTWLLAVAIIVSLSFGVGAAKPIELTYWTHTDDNRTEIENRYIAEFTKM
jgi:multiple sugar transport system substrate-binding protein